MASVPCLREDGLVGIKIPASEPHFEHPAQLPMGKLRDATSTLLRAEQIWQEYMARTPARLEAIKDHQEHAVVTVVRLAAPPPTEALSALLRSCVSDGRSALDNLVTRLAQDHGATSQQLKRAAFLVATTEAEWNRDRKSRLVALPEEMVARIRRVQPFTSSEPPAPPHPLAMLHELWLADKHRGSFSAGIGFSPRGRSFQLGTLKMTVDKERLGDVHKAMSDVDRMVDLDLAPIVDGTRLVVSRVPAQVSLDAVEVESINVRVTLGAVGPGVRITDSVIALMKNALRYARETVRYVVGGIDAPPVVFPAGLIERYDDSV